MLCSITAIGGPAKTTASDGDGNSWCTNGHWDNGIPNASKDDITISAGDSINGSCESSEIIFGSGSSLYVRNGATLVLDDTQFNNGSFIQIDAGGTLIINGKLSNSNNSDNKLINGTLIVNGELENGNGGEIFGDGTIIADSVTGDCCVMGHDPDSIPPGVEIVDSIISPPLPIELMYFNGKLIDKHIELNWVTATETNNDYFVIYKSFNGKEFVEATTVQGVGNSNFTNTYQYNDYKPFVGDNYYKLKQVDYDGKSESFNVIYVNYDEDNFKVYQYDNNIVVKNIGGCINCRLIIYDLMGNVKYNINLEFEVGYNLFHVHNLPPGTYILNLLNPTEFKSKKFIVR